MTDQKTLELRVKAQLEGVKDLKAVADAIGDIEKAIQKQTDAAKRGENVYDELKASLESLVVVQKELKNQANLIKEFRDLESAIGKTESRVTSATERYEAYRKKLNELGDVTDAQQQKLINYNKAVETATSTLARQQGQREILTRAFADAGVAVDQLSALESKNLALQVNAGATYQRNSQALKDYSANVRAARDAERALGEEAAFQKKLDDAAKLAKASEYTTFWANALDKADQAQQKLSQDNALRKSAADAEEAAKGYNTLARAADTLVPKQQSLRDAIEGILNPAKQTRSTLNGLEQEVGNLSSTISKINGPVDDYRATLDRLVATQKSVTQQASLVDDFRRQTDALRAARSEYVQARAQVLQYAEAVRQGGDAGQGFVRALAEAQARAKGASQALAEQLQITRQSRDSLREAGIATNDLGGAQQRLINITQQSANATTQLGAAVRQYGQAAKSGGGAGSGLGLFGDEGRTTLSLLQRIRGEILSITASYVGLFAVLRTGKGAVEAANTRTAIRNQLSVSAGNDKAAIDAEYAYISGQSDRIGLDLETAAKSYATFAAASKLAGRDVKETKYIFESFAEVGKVMNLSGDDMKGVFKALEQIMSKGKIQAEELRGQLGDRLPGAFAVAQKALKDQFPDLNKALEKGQVSAAYLLQFAQAYRNEIGSALPSAVSSLSAQQDRLNTAVYNFKLAIGDAGFIDSFAKALLQITEFLKSDDGQKFAESLAAGFKSAADAVVVFFQHIEEVKLALTVMTGIIAGMFANFLIAAIMKGIIAIVEFGTMLIPVVKSIAAFVAGLGAAGAAVLALLSVIASAVGGFMLGQWLYDQFAIVRKGATYMVTGVDEAFTWLIGAVKIALDSIPAIARNVMRSFVDVIAGAVRGALGIFASFASAAGLNGLADALNSTAASLKVGYEDIGVASEQTRKKLAQEIANIRSLRKDMLADIDKEDKKQATQADVRRIDNKLIKADPTAMPAVTIPKLGPSDADIAKRERQIEGITRSIEQIEARIDRSQTETLATQLAAIDVQYARIKRDITKLGGTEAVEFSARLEKDISELKAVTTDKFNKAMLKDQQAFQNKVEDLEAQAGKRQKLSLEERQNAITKKYEDYYRDLDKLYTEFVKNSRDTGVLDDARKRLDAGIEELKNLEARKFAQEELTRKEQLYNDIVKSRDAQIGAVRAGMANSSISNEDGTKRINDINQKMLPSIEAAYEATRKWAIEHEKIFDSQEAFDVFIANLDASREKIIQTKTEWTILEQGMINGIVNGVNNSLNSMVESFGKIITGQQTISQGFMGMLSAFANFAAQFLRDIAVMILKMAIFNAMKNSGNPWIAAAGAAGAASVKHSGGLIGHGGGRTRSVDTAWFANAPRYHSGGVMGLKPDEYPTILQRGEEVLAANSPRNIMNGAGGLLGAGAGGGGSAGMRVVLVDDRAKLPEAMATAEGEQVIVQAIRRNIAGIKQMMRS